MCMNVMIVNAMVKEMVCSTVSETRPRSGSSSMCATTGSPIQPSASEAIVMPSCVAEM